MCACPVFLNNPLLPSPTLAAISSSRVPDGKKHQKSRVRLRLMRNSLMHLKFPRDGIDGEMRCDPLVATTPHHVAVGASALRKHVLLALDLKQATEKLGTVKVCSVATVTTKNLSGRCCSGRQRGTVFVVGRPLMLASRATATATAGLPHLPKICKHIPHPSTQIQPLSTAHPSSRPPPAAPRYADNSLQP